MHGKRLALAIAIALGAARVGAGPQGAVSDPQVKKGIQEVEDGDYDAATITLDNAARRLATDPSRSRELSQAYLYLGLAYVGKGHEAAAKAKFREAVRQVKDLTLSPEKFPPRVIDLFEAAREEAAEAGRKKGGSKAPLLIGGVALVAGGGAAAIALAGDGGGSAGTTPTTLPPPNATGRWVGTAPDGMMITSNPSCVEEWDLALDLTQSGSSLMGTFTVTIRRHVAGAPNCSPPPPGTVQPSSPLSGSIGAGTISFSLPGEPPGGFTGTFTNTRMSGTFMATNRDGLPQTGRWAVTRQ